MAPRNLDSSYVALSIATGRICEGLGLVNDDQEVIVATCDMDVETYVQSL